MQLALFAAVPEEVGTLADQTNLTGIGRENATRSIVRFIEKHKGTPFHILNIGTVGSHDRPVGTILRIKEIVSAGKPFNAQRMLPDLLPGHYRGVEDAVLYSSDCFVSPSVFTRQYLDSIKSEADCFDMESSALFTVAHCHGIPYSSFKIVSDNLDVTIEEWRARVQELSQKLELFVREQVLSTALLLH